MARRPPSKAWLIGSAAVASVALVAGCGSEKKKKDTGQPSRDTRAISPQALPPVDLGSGVDGVAVGAGSVWVANKNNGTVTRVNPRSRRPEGATPVGANPDSVAVSGGSVWVTNTDDGDVSHIDAGTGS